MTSYQKPLSIKYWAEEDRPREKLQRLGRKSLSNAELLAILLRSGTRDCSALDLARQLLNQADNNLHNLARLKFADIIQVKGIGQAKALTIIAALELGRRRQTAEWVPRPQIRSSQDAFQLLAPFLQDLPHEEFWVLVLNRANRVLTQERVSSGGISSTIVDPRIIFEKALRHGASSVILGHNHPSDNLTPSQADLDITQKIYQAGKSLDIAVLDHLIVAAQGYYSFADEGKLD